MQENNMTEIKRFNKERRHDLVEMLKGFVSDQVQALNFVTFFVFFSFFLGGGVHSWHYFKKFSK